MPGKGLSGFKQNRMQSLGTRIIQRFPNALNDGHGILISEWSFPFRFRRRQCRRVCKNANRMLTMAT